MAVGRQLLILLFSFLALWGFPQDKSFEQIKKEMEKEFQSYVDQNQAEFDQYVESIDKEFSDYLMHVWKEFELNAGIKPDTTPKPVSLPDYKPLQKPPPPKQLVIQAPTPEIQPSPVPNIPLIQKSIPEEFEGAGEAVTFFGADVKFPYDEEMTSSLPSHFDNRDIARFWEKTSKTNYPVLVNRLAELKSRMNLNDWGYLLLTRKIAEKINPSANDSRLLTWFLLTKSGYRIRVAYMNDQVYLLFPSPNMIYGEKYFVFDHVKYYCPEATSLDAFTYDKDFPDATRFFDLNIYNALNIGEKTAERPVRVSYEGKEYSFSFRYNLNSVDFYRNYPLCDLKIHFDAAVSSVTKESVLEELRPFLQDKGQMSSVNFLLNFVQNGFEYKTDEDQFSGREKFFFPEEDFYYPYSDCDDRATFFAWLVRELVHLKVVGVLYPGHVATAIHFNYDLPGDFITWKGEKYIIADPTYVNAPLGMTMPGHDNQKAEVIELLDRQNSEELAVNIWEKALACGGKQGDNRQNLVIDKNGNSFITGYFSGEAKFGSTLLKSANDRNDAFLAKFDKKGNPVWAVKAGGNGNDIGYNIALDELANLVVTGCFGSTASFGEKAVTTTSKSDIFVAKYRNDGTLLWVNQAKVDTIYDSVNPIYVTSFTRDGEHLSTMFYPPSDNYADYGISFNKEGKVYYTASYKSTVGLSIDMVSYGLLADFNVVSSLKDEVDKQLSNNCEKTIAGLFAGINLIRVNNVVVSGKSVQEAFNKYNPSFKKIAPKVFECLGRIQVMKNAEGVVTILTEEQKPVILDKIKVQNDTRLKVIVLPSGDARIEILGGVKVGKAFIWFPLNFVRLFRTNGNVLFDYDSGHSQITLNMKKDMLF